MARRILGGFLSESDDDEYPPEEATGVNNFGLDLDFDYGNNDQEWESYESFIEEEEEEEEDNLGQEHQHNTTIDAAALQELLDAPSTMSVTLTDPDLLNCSICLEPFTAPVFQCHNGHTACSICCSKLGNKCPSCSFSIGYIRCLAIEKVLESMEVSCRNSKYGCKERVSYNNKHEHEQTCVQAPCSCPHPSCNFVGSSNQLYRHFDCCHPDSAKPFHHGSVVTVPIKTNMKFVILKERVDGTLFVLNYGVQSIGNVANITCIAPSSLNKKFMYELTAQKGSSSVNLVSFTESMPRWSEHLPRKEFLLVPCDFLGSCTMHYFRVRIWKINNESPVR